MGSWTFLHPWLLLGLVAAALPVVIHLIGRRRAPTIHFGAIDFLLAVNKRLARRERLRQFLLLLFRTLALVALVGALARPMPAQPVVAETPNRHLAIVLDASASMAYQAQGTSLLTRAKRKAQELLSHTQPGDSLGLVVAGKEIRTPTPGATADRSLIRSAIDAVGEPAGVADMGGAIERALGLFGDGAAGTTVVVIGDLSRNSFRSLRPIQLEPPPDVRLTDVADRSKPVPLANLAVEDMKVVLSQDHAAERQIAVVVRNYGAVPITDRPVELLVNGQVTQRGHVSVPALGSAEKTMTQMFDGPGVYECLARLAPSDADGFPADDQLGLITTVAAGVDVLAINGDPRTTPYEDELFFVERALAVVPKGDPPIRVRIATADELGQPVPDLDFSRFGVVLLANVGQLPSDVVDQLQVFVQGGGGLLFAAGDRVDFERANESLAAILTHSLRDVSRAADPDAGTPALGIGEMDWDHPVLQGLGLEAEASLRSSKTTHFLNVGVGSGVKARRLLRFDNGAPALLERTVGKGRLMLLSTSLDVDWSDLALRSAFPPLLQRLVRYLGGAAIPAATGVVRQGGTVELSVPTGADGVALTSPQGTRREQILGGTGQRRVGFADLSGVGRHRAELREERWQVEPGRDVMVNSSLSESDFAPVSAEAVSAALFGQGNEQRITLALAGESADVDPFASRGLASRLLLLLVVLFVGESLLAARG